MSLAQVTGKIVRPEATIRRISDYRGIFRAVRYKGRDLFTLARVVVLPPPRATYASAWAR